VNHLPTLRPPFPDQRKATIASGIIRIGQDATAAHERVIRIEHGRVQLVKGKLGTRPAIAKIRALVPRAYRVHADGHFTAYKHGIAGIGR